MNNISFYNQDAALEEIDQEDEKKKVDTSSSEYETDEEWEIERKKYLASQEKDKVETVLSFCFNISSLKKIYIYSYHFSINHEVCTSRGVNIFLMHNMSSHFHC